MYTVYWIHMSDQNDPATEGYVGITGRSAIQRLEEHKYNTKNRFLQNKVLKDGVLLTILHHNLTKEQAQSIEKSLRPVAGIGWNLAAGGDVPPPMTKELASRTKICLSGDDRTDAQKERGRKHSNFMRGREPWNKGKDLGGKRYVKKGTAAVSTMIKDRNSVTNICPKCGKVGTGPIMKRWHFENCKQ